MSALDDALEALARLEGKSVDDVEQEILTEGIKARLREKTSSLGTTRRPRELASRSETGDASAPIRRSESSIEARRRRDLDFPGTPVVRGEFDDDETPGEARERWLEQEARFPDGVHGLGGQTAGGIFGDGPIATDVYDPASLARGASVQNMRDQARAARALEGAANMVVQLAERFGLRPELPEASRSRLPGRRR